MAGVWALPREVAERVLCLHPDSEMLSAESLEAEEFCKLWAIFLARLRRAGHTIGDEATDEYSLNVAEALGTKLECVNCKKRNFDLKETFSAAGLVPGNDLVVLTWGDYVNCRTPGQAETARISFPELSKYWDAIFQADYEDMVVLDSALSWMVFCQHHGVMMFTRA